MRIIAGSLKGRHFDSPRGNRTHPMSDKIRGALFNILGDIEGLTVLDAFTGSGAIAFEALSRGAESARALDIDKGAITTVVNNARELGLSDKLQAVNVNASAWLRTQGLARFDIVVCDPPYDEVQWKLIGRLAKRAKESGIVILSLPPSATEKLPERQFELLAHKSYGDASLYFYRSNSIS